MATVSDNSVRYQAIILIIMIISHDLAPSRLPFGSLSSYWGDNCAFGYIGLIILIIIIMIIILNIIIMIIIVMIILITMIIIIIVTIIVIIIMIIMMTIISSLSHHPGIITTRLKLVGTL